MGKKWHALFHALGASPPFADPTSIQIIISANYPENFLKLHSYVFTLTALKIHDKSDVRS